MTSWVISVDASISRRYWIVTTSSMFGNNPTTSINSMLIGTVGGTTSFMVFVSEIKFLNAWLDVVSTCDLTQMLRYFINIYVGAATNKEFHLYVVLAFYLIEVVPGFGFRIAFFFGITWLTNTIDLLPHGINTGSKIELWVMYCPIWLGSFPFSYSIFLCPLLQLNYFGLLALLLCCCGRSPSRVGWSACLRLYPLSGLYLILIGCNI